MEVVIVYRVTEIGKTNIYLVLHFSLLSIQVFTFFGRQVRRKKYDGNESGMGEVF